jgi:hypothetical protein
MPVPSSSSLKYTSFSAPAIGTFGGEHFPYYHGPGYFDSDLALFKTFHIHEQQNVRFEVQAFDWLNRPLPQFSNSSQITLHYNADLATKAITVNTASYPSGNPNNFGVMDQKAGPPTQRIFELSVKYMF